MLNDGGSNLPSHQIVQKSHSRGSSMAERRVEVLFLKPLKTTMTVDRNYPSAFLVSFDLSRLKNENINHPQLRRKRLRWDSCGNFIRVQQHNYLLPE